MADARPVQPPLEVLPAMLNSVVLSFLDKVSCVADANLYNFLQLVQAGKFFRDSSSHEPKHRVPIKRVVNQSVLAANQRFHDALDEIEIEIVSNFFQQYQPLFETSSRAYPIFQ